MGNALEMIGAFASAPTKQIELQDSSGAKFPMTLARFVRQGDYDAFDKKVEGRKNLFDKSKGKLPVVVDPALLEGRAEFFPDATAPDKDGKVTIYLSSENEYRTATILETCVVEPKFTWAEAAVFVRVAGMSAFKILTEWSAVNSLDALVDAKND